MPRGERVALFQQSEAHRHSRVVSLVLGDRPGLETRMAPDVVPLMAKHLRAIGQVAQIDLVLYTQGGACRFPTARWRRSAWTAAAGQQD